MAAAQSQIAEKGRNIRAMTGVQRPTAFLPLLREATAANTPVYSLTWSAPLIQPLSHPAVSSFSQSAPAAAAGHETATPALSAGNGSFLLSTSFWWAWLM